SRDWSSDVCTSDLPIVPRDAVAFLEPVTHGPENLQRAVVANESEGQLANLGFPFFLTFTKRDDDGVQRDERLDLVGDALLAAGNDALELLGLHPLREVLRGVCLLAFHRGDDGAALAIPEQLVELLETVAVALIEPVFA